MKCVCARIAKYVIIAALVIGSGSLGAIQSAWADDVTIKSVDNHGGKSNVVTDKPNTTIIVSSLDSDGKTVESWTLTTDSNGRVTVPAGYNLSKEYLKVRTASTNMVEGMVLPSSISDRQPFTFAVPGTVEGEVIQVQTVDGEVVTTKKADRYGRVFLPAGLAAGAYMISSGSHSKPDGKIEVKPAPQDALLKPGQNQPQSLQCQIPGSINQAQPLRLGGQGFNPDAARNLVWFGRGDKPSLPILAATDQEIITSSPSGVEPGSQKVTVGNVDNGGVAAGSTFVYSIDGRLEQKTIVRPRQNETHFILSGQPANVPMKVRVIANGPVNFGGGRKEAEAELINGKADLPVHADASGNGRYQIGFSLSDEPKTTTSVEKLAFSEEQISGTSSGASGLNYYTDPWAWMGTDGWVPIPIDPIIAGRDPLKPVASGAAKKVFLDWWKDYLEGMCSFEMLDGWITSPFHWPLNEDDVRAQTRTQITALTDGAKKKLVRRLKDKAKKLRDKAKDLRKEGQDQKAQMADDQAQAMDWAANEVGNSMSSGKP
jgi:hypothetical protein